MNNQFADPPDYVDSFGNKIWVDTLCNEYAKSKQLNDVQVCFVQEPNGRQTRVIYERGKPIYENQNLESISVQLDIMGLTNEASPDKQL